MQMPRVAARPRSSARRSFSVIAELPGVPPPPAPPPLATPPAPPRPWLPAAAEPVAPPPRPPPVEVSVPDAPIGAPAPMFPGLGLTPVVGGEEGLGDPAGPTLEPGAAGERSRLGDPTAAEPPREPAAGDPPDGVPAAAGLPDPELPMVPPELPESPPDEFPREPPTELPIAPPAEPPESPPEEVPPAPPPDEAPPEEPPPPDEPPPPEDAAAVPAASESKREAITILRMEPILDIENNAGSAGPVAACGSRNG